MRSPMGSVYSSLHICTVAFAAKSGNERKTWHSVAFFVVRYPIVALWIAVIVLIVYKYKAISQFASNTKEEEKRVQREVKANPKVPPIKFKSPKEIEAEKASELNEKSATKTSSSPVKVESPQNGEDALGLSITN